MPRYALLLTATVLAAACSPTNSAAQNESSAAANATAPAEQKPVDLLSPASGTTSIVRIDCGSVDVADFTKVFSDREAYPHGHRHLASSCYLVTHNGQRLLWDTGLDAALKGKKQDIGDGLTVSVKMTVPEQLAVLGLKPADVNMVGISHNHADHVGQLPEFVGKPLLVGKPDFDAAAGKKDDPFVAWRAPGKPITPLVGDYDVFGDGNVLALFLPGHTPGHYGLLVKLKSGPVLISGDTVHAREAYKLQAVPTFNTDRNQSLQSMERMEKIAKDTGAKIVIQHDDRDIALLPPFPKAAE
jgi:glyoxylase-like metal-dependent hydrolase (beta-lactamase superfamily II)